MKLPPSFNLRETVHGTGERGMAIYCYEDTQGLGIHMTVMRQSRRHPFVETYTCSWIPNVVFKSQAEMRAAVEALTEAQEAAERSKYPFIRKTKPADPGHGNRCRICGFEKQVPAGVVVYVAQSWEESDDWRAPLCVDHAKAYSHSAKLLLEALKAEVAGREARRAAAKIQPHDPNNPFAPEKDDEL